MTRLKYYMLLLLATVMPLQTLADAVGTWRIYRSYSKIEDIVPTGNAVYVQAYGHLYSYNIQYNSVSTYTPEADGMGGDDVTRMAWNKSTHKLVIVYKDYTIDLLDDNSNVETILSLKDNSTFTEKTVNAISIYGQYAYLCTAFGIIKLNTRDAVITDTYTMGFNVADMAINGNTIYAKATDGTVYKAATTANLFDRKVWTATTTDWNSISTPRVTDTNEYGMLVYDATNKCYWGSNADGRLTEYEKEESGAYTAKNSGVIPDGPRFPEHVVIKTDGKNVYTLRGLYDMDNNESYLEGYVQTFDGNTWGVMDNTLAKTNGYKPTDFMTMDIDPTDRRHIMVGARDGLYEYFNGNMTRRYAGTPLANENTVTSISFDKKGNLWVFNRFNKSLLCMEKGGEWKEYQSAPLTMTNGTLNRYVSSFFDSRGLLWFCNNHYVGIFVGFYDTATNEARLLFNFTNQDGLGINPVNTYNGRTVSEDKDGNIWFGTSNYSVYLTPSDIKTMKSGADLSGLRVTQYKIPRNDGTGLADYLLANTAIRDIETDAANRKWVATDNNGIYVISSDCNTELEHFTTENSPLPSNDVKSICIDDNSGKVYIGTLNGLCTFESGVTKEYGTLSESNVYAYPNPVAPDYTGPITIKGLVDHTQVKIVNAAGLVVNEGISNGVTYQWDGCDKQGKRVASGIYMVLAANESGDDGCVTKIAMVK